MSKVSTLRNKIRSKIEVIKKINDNPKLTSDNLYDLYGEGVTKVDKLLQNKIGGLTSKLSKKRFCCLILVVLIDSIIYTFS